MSAIPGAIIQTEPDLEVATGRGSLILDEVQIEGRQRMQARDFVNGHRPETGSILGGN